MEGQRWGATLVRFVVGPWPFFPWVILILSSVYFALQSFQLSVVAPIAVCRVSCVRVPDAFLPGLTQQYGDVVQGYVDPVLIVINSLLVGGITALLAWLLQRWFCGDRYGVPRRSQYVVGILFLSFVAMIVRVYVLNPLLTESPGPEAFLPNFLRMLLWLTVIQSVSGQLTQRYRTLASRAEDARLDVERQRQLLLTADEGARREVAGFLHDRVQADLLVVAVRLEGVQSGAVQGPEAERTVGEAVREIERIRSIDVRSASRRLSPDFASVGLPRALTELARSWNGVMDVSIRLGGTPSWTDPDVQGMTGIYRIIEQGLLNAAAHGRANSVVVDLQREQGNLVRLWVTDNGRGMPAPHPQVGRGGSIIDAWVAGLGGTWAWGSSPGEGAWLRADLPVTQGVGGQAASTGQL